MQVRRIKDNELKRTTELFGIAFEFQVENEKSSEEVAKEARKNPHGRGELYLNDKWAAFDDDGSMMAFIATTPYNASFDGSVVKMTGIGGVSTLPQYRRNGAIRQCFNESLKYAYENDYTLSYLYPFSSAYYRQFGYELCCEKMSYTINLKSIKRFPEADGKMYLVENGSHLDDIKKVYDDFADGYNVMCPHEDIDYNYVKNANPAHDGNYIYVYKDKNDVAKGVMAFSKVKNDGRFDMQCSRFYFSDMEGFKGLINHTLAFSSYYEHVIFSLPVDIKITNYIGEWALYSYKRENYFNGMVRVINAAKALKLAKYRGTGNIVIKIADNQIEQNNHTFEVNFADSKAIYVTVCEKPFDIAMTINDFSRFLIGTNDASEFEYFDNLEINADLEKIGKVFYKKKNNIADSF